MLEGIEIIASTPRIIDSDQNIMVMRGGGNGRHILHLERQGTRRFNQDQAGFRPDMFLDTGADHRVKVGDLDAKFFQPYIAEIMGRLVGIVGDKNVVARLGKGEQGDRDSRQAGRQRDTFFAAFQGRDGVFEGKRCRRAAQAIGNVVVRVLALLIALGQRPRKDRRCMINGRIDDAEIGMGVATGGDQQRIFLHAYCPLILEPWPTASFIQVATGVSSALPHSAQDPS